MGSKSVLDLIEASSGVHYSGFHQDGLEPRNTEVEQPSTSTTESVHKQPFVIGQCQRNLFASLSSSCCDDNEREWDVFHSLFNASRLGCTNLLQ